MTRESGTPNNHSNTGMFDTSGHFPMLLPCQM